MIQENFNVALTQEIYRTPKTKIASGIGKKFQIFSSKSGRVTTISNLGSSPIEIHKSENIISIKIQNPQSSYILTNVYISHKTNLESVTQKIGDIIDSNTFPHVIAGDFNARSTLWVYANQDDRGEKLINFMLKFN